MHPRGQKTKRGRGAASSSSTRFLTGKPPLNKHNPPSKVNIRGRENAPAQTKTTIRKMSRSPSVQPINRPVYVVKTTHAKPKKHAQASGRTKNGKLKIQSSSSETLTSMNTNQHLRYQPINIPSQTSVHHYKPKAPNRRKDECEENAPKKEASGQTKIYSKPPNAPPKKRVKKPKMTSSFTATSDQQLKLNTQKKKENRRGYDDECDEEGAQQVKITSVEACIEDMNGKNSRNITNLSNVELLTPRPIMPNKAYITTKNYGDPCLDTTFDDFCNDHDGFDSPPMIIVPDSCTKAIGQVDVDCIQRTTGGSGRILPGTTFTVERPTQQQMVCRDKSDQNLTNNRSRHLKEYKSETLKTSSKTNLKAKSKEHLATKNKHKKPDYTRDESPSPSTSKKKKIKKPIISTRKPITPSASSTTNARSKPGSKAGSKAGSKPASKTASKTSLKRTHSRPRYKKGTGWNPKRWTTEQKVLYGTIGATLLILLGGLGLYYAEIIDFDLFED